MALKSGSRLGPYEIAAQIGRGGMGEVYRATDTNLKRGVAIKVLPESVASNADRVLRFQREAEVLASLNHPNIAAVYGLERTGDTTALVLELVEGPTLADRIAQGPIPIDEALPIARQIAEALEAAHERGIIHRDVKPSNIKLRPDRTVKVLDFGLAKVAEPTSLGPGPADSPTITLPSMHPDGVILGTAAYMSPEQAMGRPADKRSDTWAFGAVLYEMLTGKRAFAGEQVTDTLANVLKADPDWDALPPAVPIHVRQVLRACLRKEIKQRIGDAQDVRLALEGAFGAGIPAPGTPAGTSQPIWRRPRSIAAAVFAAVALLVASAATWTVLAPRPELTSAEPTRFVIALPEEDQFPRQSAIPVAISPDRRTLIYQAAHDGVRRLYRRPFGQFEATPIGDANADAPFFSPDGQWVGFGVERTLRKVPLSGGPSTVLADNLPGLVIGASWGADDTIVVGTAQAAGLLRVPAAGGVAESIAVPEPRRPYWFPQVLPGGRAILFTFVNIETTEAVLTLLDLETGARQSLMPGWGGRYVPTGHLVFQQGATLWAVAFDLDALAVVGEPVRVAERVRTGDYGTPQFVVSDAGDLAYVPGEPGGSAARVRRLVWVDREGHEEPVSANPRLFNRPRLSPDGTRAAVEVGEGDNRDIWIWDFEREALTPLTFDAAPDEYPVWTPDGQRVIFSSTRDGILAPYWRLADGTGSVDRLVTDPRPLDQGVVSPDGKFLILRAISPETADDLVRVTLDGGHHVESILDESFREYHGEVSPDGRWLAYTTIESGSTNVWVRPFPQVDGGRWLIGAGFDPLWSRDGRELFYRDRNNPRLMRVQVDAGASFTAGNATSLLDLSPYYSVAGRKFDISPDGRRFLMVREARTGPDQINLVLNWFGELRRLVPMTGQ